MLDYIPMVSRIRITWLQASGMSNPFGDFPGWLAARCSGRKRVGKKHFNFRRIVDKRQGECRTIGLGRKDRTKLFAGSKIRP